MFLLEFWPRTFTIELYENAYKIGDYDFGVYCNSRIVRMHVIFVYFVRDGLCTERKCIRKVQSKSENLHRSAAAAVP